MTDGPVSWFEFESRRIHNGRVVELADTHDSKSCAERRVGSTPTLVTLKKRL